eukprot:5214788-Amphidinium_carterae.1
MECLGLRWPKLVAARQRPGCKVSDFLGNEISLARCGVQLQALRRWDSATRFRVPGATNVAGK